MKAEDMKVFVHGNNVDIDNPTYTTWYFRELCKIDYMNDNLYKKTGFDTRFPVVLKKVLYVYTNNATKGKRRIDNQNDLIINFVLKEDEVTNFIYFLKRGGIKSIVLTTESTGLMENIHWLVEAGCEFAGIYKTDDNEKGIKFEL